MVGLRVRQMWIEIIGVFGFEFIIGVIAAFMPPSQLAPSAPPPTGRYLSLIEREQIALLRAQRQGVREIARHLARSASTISRELRRNAATRSGGFEYRAITAQWHADRAARRPKPAKLAVNAALRSYVQDRLAGKVATAAGKSIAGPMSLCRTARPGFAASLCHILRLLFALLRISRAGPARRDALARFPWASIRGIRVQRRQYPAPTERPKFRPLDRTEVAAGREASMGA